MSTPLSIYRAAERYVKSTAAMHPGIAATIAAKRAGQVCQELNNMAFDQQHAAELQEALMTRDGHDVDDSPFSAEDRQLISATILSICDGEASVATLENLYRAKEQSCLHWFKYLPESLWEVFKSQDTLKNKFRQAAHVNCIVLQLRNPCNATKQVIVATIHVATGVEARSPDESYWDIRDFTNVMVTTRTGIPGTQSLKEFLAEPEEFLKRYPSAYADEHPTSEENPTSLQQE